MRQTNKKWDKIRHKAYHEFTFPTLQRKSSFSLHGGQLFESTTTAQSRFEFAFRFVRDYKMDVQDIDGGQRANAVTMGSASPAANGNRHTSVAEAGVELGALGSSTQTEAPTDGNHDENYRNDSKSLLKDPAEPESNDQSPTEPNSVSPTFQKSLSTRKEHPRLRSIIQPGDDGKRPGSFIVHEPQAVTNLPTTTKYYLSTPHREPDLKVLKTRKGAQINGATGIKNETLNPAHTKSPKDISPLPASVTKKSLEDNNHVYELIQAENAKRQNAVSDGSVQAVVVPVPEQKHILRHRAKRDLLREDSSSTRNSLPSSIENSSRKSRYRTSTTIPGDSDTAVTSPESSPSQKSEMKYAPESEGFARWSEAQKERRRAKPSAPNTSAPVLAIATESPIARQHSLRRSTRQKTLDKELPKLQRAIEQNNDTERQRPHTSGLDDSPTLPHKGWLSQPKLRRSSHEARLENNTEVRRTSINRDSYRPSQVLEAKLEQAAKDLTLEGQAMSEKDVAHDQRYSLGKRQTTTSPRRESFGMHALYPAQTSFSVSQTSERSEVELCQARGVELFPHNNDSLLVVQQRSPSDRDRNTKTDSDYLANSEKAIISKPTFTAYVDAPADRSDGITENALAPDSPFMRQGAAPKPPVINFIPPTPSQELECRGGSPRDSGDSTPVRRPSLSQKVRRYSGGLVQPFIFGRNGTLRRQEQNRISSAPEQRPTYLSSSWQRRDYWNEYDSDESEFEDVGPLPPGGDTSEVAKSKRNLFPRNMSVRMPGFRGSGGFLVGNTLGIDRHGTNNRRHYVAKRTSKEMLRYMNDQRNGRIFTLPFTGGVQVQYVGLEPIRARLQDMRAKREERAVEKRRQKLRGQIGMKMYHDEPKVVP